MKKKFLALALAVIMSLSLITVISTSAEPLTTRLDEHHCNIYKEANLEYLDYDVDDHDFDWETVEDGPIIRYLSVASSGFTNESLRNPFVLDRVVGDRQRWYIAQLMIPTDGETIKETTYRVPAFYNGKVVSFDAIIAHENDKVRIYVKLSSDYEGEGDLVYTDKPEKEVALTNDIADMADDVNIEYSPMIFQAITEYAKNAIENFDETLFNVSWKYNERCFSNSLEKNLFGVWDLSKYGSGYKNHYTAYYLTAEANEFTTQQLYPTSCVFTFEIKEQIHITEENYTEYCKYTHVKNESAPKHQHKIVCKYCDRVIGVGNCVDDYTYTTMFTGTEAEECPDGYCDICGEVIDEELVANKVMVNLTTFKLGTSKLAKYFGFKEKTYFTYYIKVDTSGPSGKYDEVASIEYSYEIDDWKKGNIFIITEPKEMFFIKVNYTSGDVEFYICETMYDENISENVSGYYVAVMRADPT